MARTRRVEPTKGLSIRFPVSTYEAFTKDADENRRSYGGEVVYLVEKALKIRSRNHD